MKNLILLSAIFVCKVSWASAEAVHHVEGNETAWFIAQIYYAKGNSYPQILEANHLKTAEEIHPGMDLKIPQPKFDVQTSSFKERLAQMRADRNQGKVEKALSLKAPSKASLVDQAQKELRNPALKTAGQASGDQ